MNGLRKLLFQITHSEYSIKDLDELVHTATRTKGHAHAQDFMFSTDLCSQQEQFIYLSTSLYSKMQKRAFFSILSFIYCGGSIQHLQIYPNIFFLSKFPWCVIHLLDKLP